MCASLALGYVCQLVFQYSSSERSDVVDEDMAFDVVVLVLGTDGAYARYLLIVRLHILVEVLYSDSLRADYGFGNAREAEAAFAEWHCFFALLDDFGVDEDLFESGALRVVVG